MGSETIAEGKKENAALTAASLNALARQVREKGLVLAMLLNIPTKRLVHIRCEGQNDGKSDDAMTSAMLLLWRELRKTAKDKEKASQLENALRDIGKQELADIFNDKYQSDSEMTADCFPPN